MIPNKAFLCYSAAEGATELNAFDNALLSAGVGNFNFLKLSSILPPKTIVVDKIDLPDGSIVPAVYTSIVGKSPKEVISSSISIAIPNADKAGVIMEYSGKCSQKLAEKKTEEMIKEAMKARKIKTYKIKTISIEHTVKKIGCTFACVLLI